MKVTAILPLLISVFVASVLFTRVTGQNPCLGVPCNSTHICRIVSGVAVCVPCEPGFENIGGISCVPIATDPCDPTPCDSNEICEDVNGAAVCTDCPSGFTAVNNVCEDIDECTTETDNCDENANCTNNIGSFTCACNPGYSGDGVNCTDINECLTGNVCDPGSCCCNNLGSYVCLKWHDLKRLLFGGFKLHKPIWFGTTSLQGKIKKKYNCDFKLPWWWWWWRRQDGEVDLEA